MCNCNVQETVIDVRSIVPRMRHPIVFGTYDMLAPGEAFVLVNDHDPRPLHYQLATQWPGEFTWEYEEQGPDLWRVRIAKAA